MPNRVLTSKEELVELYKNQGMTTYQVADAIGCCQATVWKRLRQFGVPAHERYRVPITKKQLRGLYWTQRLSTRKIAKKFGITRSWVFQKLNEWNIPTRDIAESHIFNKKPFSGSPTEKAYLIGFRIGDLNVTKNGPKSKTIQVKLGTTIREQVMLFEKLFSPYCKVWKKKTATGKINLQAGVDETFNFLLPKKEPRQIFNKPNVFFPFLAGFVDAEGCIRISNGRAYLALGNMNRPLLCRIKKTLERLEFEIPKIIYSDHTQYVGKDGSGHNGPYYTIRVNKKTTLLRLLSKIVRFSRHPNKIKDIKLAINNIVQRNGKEAQ